MQGNGAHRCHYTQITKLEALFSPAEGWPLSLSAIPPSRELLAPDLVARHPEGCTTLLVSHRPVDPAP